MSSSESFRFRLRLASTQPGKFSFPNPEVKLDVSDDVTFEFLPRNAATLDQATEFHIDGVGFLSADEARAASEALRIRLRLLNAILGLGLNIPVGNKVSGQVSQELKDKLLTEQGATVVDGVWGAFVFPDDGMHFEYVFTGDLEVHPSDSSYILEGLKKLWNLEVSLDQQSEDALHILCLATQESTDKSAFLASYLALEQLVERRPRSEAAREALDRFRQELANLGADGAHALSADEAESLAGVIGSLREESFPSALSRLGKRIVQPTDICGVPVAKFLSACVTARNKIAHHAEPDTTIPLADLAKALREFVLMLIWTRNKLPNFSLQTPPSRVRFPVGGLSIKVM